MDNGSLGIVFGRPWLSGDADILKGFELGRLGLACLSTEQIILHTHSFTEIPYLIRAIGHKVFFDEIKNGKLKFVCQIENVGIYNLTDIQKATGTMIYPVELVELRKNRDIQLFESLLQDENLKSDDIKLLFNSITFTPESLSKEIMSALIRDLRDLKTRSVIMEFFQEWFNTKENVLDFLKFEGEASVLFSVVPAESKGFSDSKLQTLFFILHTAYSQIAICNILKVPQIFSDKVIFDLQFAVMKAKESGLIEKVEEVIDTTTKSIELPNISWLVSRDILPVSKLFSFKNSKEGKEFRNFLKTFKDEDKDVIQKVQQSLIKSLHGKTEWESAWESGVSQVVRLTVATGLGLIPGIGTILGLGATAVDIAVDKAMPRNYRPTVVLDNMISKNTDVEKITKEKSRVTKYPSLDELEEKGFEVSFFLINSLKTKAWIFLDKPGVEEHWELGLDFNVDATLRGYFEGFMSKIANHSKDIQEFIEILKDGGKINNQTTNFSRSPETGESSLVLKYEVESSSGVRTFSSGEREFWNYIQGRKYFGHPRDYNRKISKILIEFDQEKAKA